MPIMDAGGRLDRGRQRRLLLVDETVLLVHSGPCIEALWDEEDSGDPAQVTCPHCIARRTRVKAMTWAQRRRDGVRTP